MSVIVQSGVVLNPTIPGGGISDGDNPVIGYESRVTTSNVSATTEATGSPVKNVANPSTNLRWEGEGGSPDVDEYLTVNLDSEELVDYVAIARHNFNAAQVAVSVEYFDTVGSPTEWVELIAPVIPGDDAPLLFRFEAQSFTQIRIRMQPGSAAPYVGVLYIGELLVLQRRIYVGHSPMKYNVQTNAINAQSQAGDFLGRIILSQMTSGKVSLKNLTPEWTRTHLIPFLVFARQSPFFFAWRPETYPDEVNYAWMTNDPEPQNQLPNGMMMVDLEIKGIRT